MARGIIFAMENDGQDLDDGSEVNEAEVASALNETTGEAAEIENDADMVTDAADDANAVGDIRDEMQESVDSGEGLDETAAEIAEVAIEAYARRLGYGARGRILPAKESFGGRSSRIQATRLAIEKADNIFKRAWDAIVSTVKKIFKKIVEWFRKLFDNTGKLKKAAGKMKVDYGEKLVKPAFESSIAKNISFKPGELEVKQIIESLDETNDFIQKDLGDINSGIKTILKKAKDQAKTYKKAGNKKNDKNEIRAFIKEIIDDVKASLGKFDTDKAKAAGEIKLWGRKYLNVTIIDSSDVGDNLELSTKGDGGKGRFVMVETLPVPIDREGNVAVKAWTSSEGAKLKSSTEALANTVASYTKETRKYEDLQKEILDMIDELKELGDSAKKDDAEETIGKKEFNKMMDTFRTLIVDLTNAVAKINGPMLSSASSFSTAVIALNNENAKCWAKK